MSHHELINELADAVGMGREYLDWAGKPLVVNPDYKVPLLEAMGFDMGSESAIRTAIAAESERQWQRLVPVVVVLHQGKPFEISLRIPVYQAKGLRRVEIRLENGDLRQFDLHLDELEVQESGLLKGEKHVALKVSLPCDLPLGYHRLEVSGCDQHCSVIVAPQVCYEPEALEQGAKVWGSGVQLYSVRSRENWGMGDYRDLKTLCQGLGENGAGFVGLNPVHALYSANPQHCSPYSPSSRAFANVLYIQPEMIPEYGHCQQARAMVEDEAFQQRLEAVRGEDYIDYQSAAELKLSVLEVIYRHFEKHHIQQKTSRARDFAAFCEERGDSLRQFATFEALFEHFRKQDRMNWGWPCWPEAYQHPDSEEVRAFARENLERLRYFEYLQWVAEDQIALAQKSAKEAGMLIGAYRDLAVGVDRGGADVWGNRRLYVLDASTGAPPDGLGPQGQNWGLPPFHPQVLEEEAYQPFIELIRSNMRNCGALRIDHAMGLFRLWWCPNGKGAAYGAYVHYPLQDLLGIIKLESQRQKCLVFGEDLGTVPQEITASLPPARFYSSVMGIFQCQGDQFTPGDQYKKKALATLVCHDTPTLRGWWEELDIDLCAQLGFFDQEREASEREARESGRKAVINTLHRMGENPEGVAPHGEHSPAYSREIMERFSYYLVLSASQITGIQLEDCMMIKTPVNLPGTSEEYPNWRRRLTENLDSFFASEGNQRFFASLTGCRQKMS